MRRPDGWDALPAAVPRRRSSTRADSRADAADLTLAHTPHARRTAATKPPGPPPCPSAPRAFLLPQRSAEGLSPLPLPVPTTSRSDPSPVPPVAPSPS
ncbi:hypothetical protein GQ55_9G529600 [Panicum hallii var. hallii]|uniref:Uncharacterized protein n=1 Tax=Panicum hallii var. hallii TaxID=1504633 RepID=A0A2T7CEK1_9POAL|nr:hypothetical protein GQ55_9G529600 [Panicum hallii var. hallii]